MIMGITKAILVGVSEYPALNLTQLPLCKNDLLEMKKALISGLNITENNILLHGENGIVIKKDLFNSIISFINKSNKDDTLIFYFSGHGSKNTLALSDCMVNLQSLVDLIEEIQIKCKIIILDSCHSGYVDISDVPQVDINESVEFFSGYGYAVMASCTSEQASRFDYNRNMSLYTRFVCDALTSKFLIRDGKKSLESINQAIFRFAEMENNKTSKSIQSPIFRSKIGGTIFFDVEDYYPYKSKEIYEETDNYIIYSVEPIKNRNAKQLKSKIILRLPCTMETISDYSKEICQRILYEEIYSDSISETRYKGKASNIITCHFGYDELDMVSDCYVCYTVWIDDTQNRDIWYRKSKNTHWVNDVYVNQNNSYFTMKTLQNSSMDADQLIDITKECTANIINTSEKAIKIFRDFLNTDISEEQLIEKLAPLKKELFKWYMKQSDLPYPPDNLKKWSDANINLANVSIDFSMIYDKQNLSKVSSENRKRLMIESIHKYEEALEELKIIDF